eukprot:GHRR01004763.1.p1 GENE.GHRR01004763.1~~GHRR01004763.1.p1  ORF type:complete len:241 (+),score=64.54 GHRR01004763.1:247-969(+)
MRPWAAVLCTLLLACITCHAAQTASWPVANDAKVDVDLFVMSKCPDAFYCEEVLGPVLADLKEDIALTMHYIGQKQDDGSYTCKHGPEECDGNLQQLCVQLHSPIEQRYDWLYRFALCNNKEGKEAIGQITTAAKCLKEAGIPLGTAVQVLGCIVGPGHAALLQQELSHTAALGVGRSCTIQVESNTICVRDDEQWKDCPAGTTPDDFKEVICGYYATKNKGHLPPSCKPTSAVAELIAT